MKEINNTEELIEVYNKCKDKIICSVRNSIKRYKTNVQRFSVAYSIIQNEIVVNIGYKLSDCQCNKLTYMVLEEIMKDGE